MCKSGEWPPDFNHVISRMSVALIARVVFTDIWPLGLWGLTAGHNANEVSSQADIFSNDVPPELPVISFDVPKRRL